MPNRGTGGGSRRGDERLPPRAAPRAVEAGNRHRRPHPRHGGNRRGRRAVPGGPHLSRPVRLEGASVPGNRVRIHRSLRRTVPDPDARGTDPTARHLRALLDVGHRGPETCRRPDGPLLPHGGGAQDPGARSGTGAALLHPKGERGGAGAGGVPRRLFLGVRPRGEPAVLPGVVGEGGGHPAGGGRPVPAPSPPGGLAGVPRASPGRDDLPARRPGGRREKRRRGRRRVPRDAGSVEGAGDPPRGGTGKAGRRPRRGCLLPRLPSARRHADAVRGGGRRRLSIAVRIVRDGAAGGAHVGRPGRRAGGDVLGGPDPFGGRGARLPREEPDRFSGALLELASSAELRARLSMGGAAVAAPFTWEKCTASWAELLASVSTPGSPR